jgi:hypothetical protein
MEKRKWYVKKRFLFPLAFLAGGVAAFIESLISAILRYT